MSNKKRIGTNKKPAQATKPMGTVTVKGTTTSGKKVEITTGDKNAQVLAATVGGAVLGNLIFPGVGGAVVGGIVGAILGNDSSGKGRK
ncbi:MAG: hypothetical protein OEW36_05955 [Hylemonella sp.]|nr:hypothetical protein [Hylemonella sp.]